MELIDSCSKLQTRGGWAEDAAEGRCSFPIGPRNTWSNLAYPAVAVALLGVWTDPGTIVMAVALTVLGIGSGLYHGFKTRWANKLDWCGMYLVFGALSVHSFHPGNPNTWMAMALTGVLLAVLFSYVVANKVNLDVQMGLLLWFSALPVVLHGHIALVGTSMALFVAAFVCWELDLARHLVGRWGHALWHILTALAIGSMYAAQQGI